MRRKDSSPQRERKFWRQEDLMMERNRREREREGGREVSRYVTFPKKLEIVVFLRSIVERYIRVATATATLIIIVRSLNPMNRKN